MRFNQVTIGSRRYRYGQVYRLGAVKFRIYRRDFNALRLLSRILAAGDRSKLTWLLPYRREIHRIRRSGAAAALTLVALEAEDRGVLELVLWLRGGLTSKVGCKQLLAHAQKNEPAVQVWVARTLHRMGAWAQYRELVQHLRENGFELDLPELGTEAFPEKLKKFVKNLKNLEVPERVCPLFISNSTPITGKPAKPKWLIRLVLDRIRLLVSAKHSTDRLPKESDVHA